MCGIGAILHLHPNGTPVPSHPIDSRWLDALDHAIAYRGPDGQGRYTDQRTTPAGDTATLALLHRRLSILDHSGGAQPMTRGGITVVFNGCIYNHRALRADLQSLGHHFTTDHSDTEVLLHGWKQWQHDLWPKLDGMFAVILWDSTTCEIVLARDGFGEKPLFLAHAGPYLIAASTIAAIDAVLNHPNFPAPRTINTNPLDQPGAIQLLSFGSVMSTHAWRGIHRLPTQTAHSNIQPATGWRDRMPTGLYDHGWLCMQSLNLAKARPQSTPQSVIESQVESSLRASVQSRLEADVPLAALLSGGVDSSLVCTFAKEVLPDLQTICIRMSDPRYDESAHAERVARHLGTNHLTIDVSPDPITDLEHLISLIGFPFGDSSLLPTYWACRAAGQHAKVLLTGDGGDELFFGYERHQLIEFMSTWWFLSPLARLIPDALIPGGHPKSKASKFGRLLRAIAGEGYADLTAIFPTQDRKSLITSPAAKPRLNTTLATAHGIWDQFHLLPDLLLSKVDHASLAAGIESRAPFLASAIADVACSLSRQQRMPGNQRKGLLRAIARKHLPADIVDRPKMGFAIPIGDWFRSDFGSLNTFLADLLSSADPFPPSLVGCELNLPWARQLHAEHLSNTRDHSQRLYMLLVLAIWCCQQRSLPHPRYAPSV